MANTTILKCKCMACSLHFAVYTNFPDEWKERRPICPECGRNGEDGQPGVWVLGVEESDKYIFQFVSA